MTESVSLTVTGMKCGGCEANVTSKLEAIDGVLSVNASSKNNEVNVEFDAEKPAWMLLLTLLSTQVLP